MSVRGFTQPEMRFVVPGQRDLPVSRRCDQDGLVSVLAKILAANNEAHLGGRGLAMPVIPVSSLLRAHAVTHNDAELNEERNFQAIVNFLSSEIAPVRPTGFGIG